VAHGLWLPAIGEKLWDNSPYYFQTAYNFNSVSY
jgi:hypothetical protein